MRGDRLRMPHTMRNGCAARRTLGEIADDTGVSVPTLCSRFDALPAVPALKPPPERPVNLVREYGYLCFHDTRRIVHFREIETESLEDLDRGLDVLTDAGYPLQKLHHRRQAGLYAPAAAALSPHPGADVPFSPESHRQALYHQQPENPLRTRSERPDERLRAAGPARLDRQALCPARTA